PDEQTAKQRVLNQFGDPIKIACQLWLDAMKEKIMSQRIMTGISAVMAVCCIAVVGIAWILVQESRVVNHKMLEQLVAIADRPQPVAPAGRDQQILDQLKELKQEQQAAANASSEGMNQLSFQLIQDNKDKKPAVNFKGTLTKSGNQTESCSRDAVSNAAGTLDFGILPWGRYQLNLNSPWGESFHQFVTVIPGRNYSQKIICPAEAPEKVPVQFQVNWPGDSNAEDWVLLCDFRNSSDGKHQFESSRLIADQNWIYKRIQQDHFNGVYLISNKNLITACPLGREGEYEDIDSKQLVETSSIKMSQGIYVLPDLILVQKKDLQRLSELNEQKNYRLLNKNSSTIGTYSLEYRRLLGSINGFSTSGIDTFLVIPFQNASTLLTQVDPINVTDAQQYAAGLALPKQLVFTASQSEENLWKIKLPDLIDLKMPEAFRGAGQGFF
ncbi:MAG: hypothetical protein ABIK07_02110, partial [Planctomycetota bacterium]